MPETRLRDLARRLLGERESLLPEGVRRRAERVATSPLEPVAIERVALDVRVGDRVEAVTIVVRDGELAWSCTDGSAGRQGSGAPASPFVRAALRWLAVPGAADVEADTTPAGPAGRSLRPPAALDDEQARRLASALDEVVTSVVRAGIAGRDSPSVRDAIASVAASVSSVSTTLSRWIGRIEGALAAGDVVLLAQLLEGAARAADDLRAPGESARARAAAWTARRFQAGASPTVDRTLIEVARETLDGLRRAAIERRYLLDLGSGEIFREERLRSEPAPSLGPCPRALGVGLAEIEDAGVPRRIRLLQYSVRLEVAAADVERVRASAIRRTSILVETYRAAVREWPALAEPVAVVAAAGARDGIVLDAGGEPIPLVDDDAGACAVLVGAAREGDLDWIAGRVVEVAGTIRVVPCSFARRGAIVRLR